MPKKNFKSFRDTLAFMRSVFGAALFKQGGPWSYTFLVRNDEDRAIVVGKANRIFPPKSQRDHLELSYVAKVEDGYLDKW